MSRFKKVDRAFAELAFAISALKREIRERELQGFRRFRGSTRKSLSNQSKNGIKLILIQGGKPSDDFEGQ